MDCGKLTTNHGEEFKSGHARHIEIRKNNLGQLAADMAQCGESVFRRAHTISKLGKEVRHQQIGRASCRTGVQTCALPILLRSERIISGNSLRIWRSAENPSSAERTLYPNSVKRCVINIRIEGSSSTIRSLTFAWNICHLTNLRA